MSEPVNVARFTPSIAAAAIMLVVAGCATGPEVPATAPEPTPANAVAPGDDEPTPTGPEDIPAGTPDTTPSVPEVLDFTADRIGGGQVIGAEHAGQAVALWFWAPW